MREFHALIVDLSRRFLPLVVKYPWFLPWNNTNKVRENMILVSVETSHPSNCQYILAPLVMYHVALTLPSLLLSSVSAFLFCFSLLSWNRRETEGESISVCVCFMWNYFSLAPTVHLCFIVRNCSAMMNIIYIPLSQPVPPYISVISPSPSVI